MEFWSLIAANRRRTVLLMLFMGAVLLVTGAAIGLAVVPVKGAALIGGSVAGVVWVIMLCTSWWGGEKMLLSGTGAHEVDHEFAPQLVNVVEEMAIAAGLKQPPRIFLLDSTALNAFAVGRRPEHCAVCVTAGLVAACTRDELQGVVAHEIGHIINRDTLYLTVAATLLGATAFVSDLFLRGGDDVCDVRFRCDMDGITPATVLFFAVALVMVLVGPLLVRGLYFCVSRRREYLADATSARLTRYPEGLASALEKISGGYHTVIAPSGMTPLFITPPRAMGDNPFATHPPTDERIRILRGMNRDAGYREYMRAYGTVTRRRSPARRDEITGARRVPMREGDKNAARQGRRSTRRAGDIIRSVNDHVFIPCPCGMEIKVPPGFSGEEVRCPRCGHTHRIPRASRGHAGAVLQAAAFMAAENQDRPAPRQTQQVQRTPGDWQNLTCVHCGRQLQLSPRFEGRKLRCTGCGATIEIQ